MTVDEEPPVVELDLDAPAGVPASAPQDVAPAARAGRRRRWAVPVAAGLAGALLGAGAVVALDRVQQRGTTDVQVALGPSGAQLLAQQSPGRQLVRLSTLAVNEGRAPITVRGVHVEGDGAALARSYRGEASIFPFDLQPGQSGLMPILLASDCAVRSPTPPRVSVDVIAADGTLRTVDVRIPGLDEMWRRAVSVDGCS
ncbi:MAG TPA: hypothetical protein VE781_09795 [Kineosporiaceae bacterium]|nr:hypothetical protein [Kineosporiaceae bacterium]